MNQDTKQMAIFSSATLITILGALLMVSSCVREENKLYQTYRLACIERGGEMQLVPGMAETFFCKQK